MDRRVKEILHKRNLSHEDIVFLLGTDGAERKYLFERSAEIKHRYVGNKVYYRGLVEFSNICSKNCFYCGIRKDNNVLERYNLSDREILDACRFANENNYGSVVLQSGEIEGHVFTERISSLLKQIKELSGGSLGITISLGEQTGDVYKEWFDMGAHRYLLRIESSDKELYSMLHPDDSLHTYNRRIDSLKKLQKTGYQTGTGVMIGLPL